MSHQVFVDKMLFVLCTPMVFLAESSFVIARSKTHPSNGPFFVMFWSRKHIQLGNSAPMSFRHLRSGPSTVSCVLLRRTCLRRTPPHYIRSAHQCAGRAVYFAAAKYGKAGRPPGGSHVSGGQGAGAPKVSGSLAVCVSRFSRIIVLTCYFVLMVYCRLAENQASLLWQTIVRLLWFYLGTRGVPQNVVEASANSLWQGGWRRTHSVKGGLPK